MVLVPFLSKVVNLTEEKIVMRTAEGPFPMETSYEWIAINTETTRMLLKNKGNPTGFSKILSPFISKFMRKANQKDLNNLKQILEKN